MKNDKQNELSKKEINKIVDKILEENNHVFKILSKYDTFVYDLFCSAVMEYELNFVAKNNITGKVFASITTNNKYTLIITTLAESNLESILRVLSNDDALNLKKNVINQYKIIHENPEIFEKIDLHFEASNKYIKVILNDYAIIFYTESNNIYISNVIYIGKDFQLGTKIENSQNEDLIKMAILELESKFKDDEDPIRYTLEEFTEMGKKLYGK